MINAINNTQQTVLPGANILFNGSNVRTRSCSSCCGWLNHNINSGLFEITKSGIYEITFSANVAPTVAGPITLNITNGGENIIGGEMQTPGTTEGVFENVSATILVEVPCNCCDTFTIKNNIPTNPITVGIGPSIVITKVA